MKQKQQNSQVYVCTLNEFIDWLKREFPEFSDTFNDDSARILKVLACKVSADVYAEQPMYIIGEEDEVLKFKTVDDAKDFIHCFGYYKFMIEVTHLPSYIYENGLWQVTISSDLSSSRKGFKVILTKPFKPNGMRKPGFCDVKRITLRYILKWLRSTYENTHNCNYQSINTDEELLWAFACKLGTDSRYDGQPEVGKFDTPKDAWDFIKKFADWDFDVCSEKDKGNYYRVTVTPVGYKKLAFDMFTFEPFDNLMF